MLTGVIIHAFTGLKLKAEKKRSVKKRSRREARKKKGHNSQDVVLKN